MVLSHFLPSQTIGTPEAYGQIKIHDNTCNFLGSIKYGKAPPYPHLTRIMHQRKRWV